MRLAASFGTAISAFCAAAVLTGCGSTADAPATSSPPASSVTAGSPPSSATAGSPPAATVPAGWTTHMTSDGTLAFDYPETWTVKDPAGVPAEGGVAVDLISDYGKTMASLRTNMVTGAECTATSPYMVYDSEPVPALTQGGITARFVYEGRTGPSSGNQGPSLTLAYGLTSAPEPTGDAACPIFHFFTWPPSGAMFGGGYDPFDTTPGGPMHVDTPEAYQDTPEYKNVKQSIMSLRPAGKP